MYPKMKGSHYKQVAYYVPHLKNLDKKLIKTKMTIKKQHSKSLIKQQEMCDKFIFQGIFITHDASSSGKKWTVINGRRDVIQDDNPGILIIIARKEVHNILQRCFVNTQTRQDAIVHNISEDYKDTYQDTKTVPITLHDVARIALATYLPDKEDKND